MDNLLMTALTLIGAFAAAFFLGKKKSDDQHKEDVIKSVLKVEKKEEEVKNEVSQKSLSDLVNDDNSKFKS